MKNKDDASNTRPELHISWEDLLEAKEGGGRWWIVGSPWQQKRNAEKRGAAASGGAGSNAEAVSGSISGCGVDGGCGGGESR